MPELAEVEFGRKLAERVLVGRKIQRAWVARDSIVIADVSHRRLTEALEGRRVRAAHRKGKYIWLELDRRPWPIFHFGMTGAFRVKGERALQLEASPKEPDRSWPPKFTKIHLFASGGGELVMTNARRLGRIRLQEDPLAEAPIAKLGFDPLLEPPSLRAFREMLEGRKVTLKGLLLDQSFAAGTGNWLADEILYQAGIDPRRKANSLAPEEQKRVLAKLKSIVKTAVKVDADKTRFPKAWLFHQRWGKDADARTARGEKIEHITVAGRTTAWVPSAQS